MKFEVLLRSYIISVKMLKKHYFCNFPIFGFGLEGVKTCFFFFKYILKTFLCITFLESTSKGINKFTTGIWCKFNILDA